MRPAVILHSALGHTASASGEKIAHLHCNERSEAQVSPPKCTPALPLTTFGDATRWRAVPGNAAARNDTAMVNQLYVLAWIHGRVCANSCPVNSWHVSGLPRLSPSPAPAGMARYAYLHCRERRA